MLHSGKRTVLLCIVCAAFLSSAGAETFRVHKLELAEISAQTVSQKVRLGYNDALAVKLPKNRMFFQGVELEIKIPQTLLDYRGSIAYSLYSDVTPPPSASAIDYSGTRILIDTFPARLSLILQIPVIKQHKIKTSPYAVLLPLFVPAEDGVIFVRFQPVMKGLPENIEELVFEIDVKSILLNEGLLSLVIKYPTESENKEFSLFIDENPVSFAVQPLILSSGVHHLAVVSEFFKNEVRTFTIEQAKTTTIEIALKDIAPTLLITAPQNAKVYLDSQEAETGKELVVTPGEHTVRFVVGDYEVLKTVTAAAGKTYNVSLTIDIQVSETP